MSSQERGPVSDDVDNSSDVEVVVDNLGGIDHCEITFQSGVTVLEGRNATNRTSLLRSLSGVLGGSAGRLKSDVDEGKITFVEDGERYVRKYTKQENTVRTSGSTYTEDETLIDLFVSLLEDNPVRHAVKYDGDLHNILMRPVDTEDIDQRISDLKRKREAIESELKDTKRRRDTLQDLEAKRRDLEEEIEDIDDELAMRREEVEEANADVESAEEAEELMDRLKQKRQQLAKTEDKRDVVVAELEAVRSEVDRIDDDLDELPERTKQELTEIDSKLRSARDEKNRIEEQISSLNTIINFNQKILSGGDDAVSEIEFTDQNLVAELAPEADQDIVCWTCGSQVRKGDITDQLADINDVIEEKRAERDDLDERIATLKTEKDEIVDATDRREQLKQKQDQVEKKIERKQDRRGDLEETASNLREEITDLEEEASRLEELKESEVLEKHNLISNLEYERGQVDQQLQETIEEIEEIKDLPDPDTLVAQREDVTDSLERERGRIDELESQIVETFNDHMGSILSILGYNNIARVWIEKKTNDRGRGQPETTFELHVVREKDDGTVYEDTTTNLSESEREVVGLIVALAGYLSHEMYDRTPFILLDSVEIIDSDRISDLVDYLADYTKYLIVALLPEDAEDLNADSHETMEPTS